MCILSSCGVISSQGTGWTAIFFAAKNGSVEIVQNLLHHKAKTELDVSCKYSLSDLLKLLFCIIMPIFNLCVSDINSCLLIVFCLANCLSASSLIGWYSSD